MDRTGRAVTGLEARSPYRAASERPVCRSGSKCVGVGLAKMLATEERRSITTHSPGRCLTVGVVAAGPVMHRCCLVTGKRSASCRPRTQFLG
jgi:hypothetical protein